MSVYSTSRACFALTILAASFAVSRAEIHTRLVIGTAVERDGELYDHLDTGQSLEGSVDDARRLSEVNLRFGAAARRVPVGDGDEQNVFDHISFPSTGRVERRGKGLASLERRVIDIREEFAAEANGTKARHTSVKSTSTMSTEPASARSVSRKEHHHSNASGVRKGNKDPRWGLLVFDDKDDHPSSHPEDLGRDSTSTSSSQLLIVTDGRGGVVDALNASLHSHGGTLGDTVPTMSYIAIGGLDAARDAADVPGVIWVGSMRPQDAVSVAWDPILAAIESGNHDAIKRTLSNVETIRGFITVMVFIPPLQSDSGDATRGLVESLAVRIRAGIVVAMGGIPASVTASSSGRFVLVYVKTEGLPRAIEWLSTCKAVHRIEPKFIFHNAARILPSTGHQNSGRSLLNYEANEVVQGGELAGANTKTPFYDANITGAGQVVGAGDSGLDGRNCAFSGVGKVAMNRSLTGDFSDVSKHGTHVVGSILGKLSTDDSPSTFDGVAKDASIAFTDRGYSIKSNRFCACLNALTCTVADAYDDIDGDYHTMHPNGAAPDRTGMILFDTFLPYENVLACNDGSGTRKCTRYDRTCAAEGYTDWLPDGAPWNVCCDGEPGGALSLDYCSHDASTNGAKFACTDGSQVLCRDSSQTLPCNSYQNSNGIAWTYLLPSGYHPAAKERLKNIDDMAADFYDHAKDVGAYIHSDSWGANTPAYGESSYQVDKYAWNNLAFLPLFAAGNEGKQENSQALLYNYTDGRYTLGNPTNSKNCVSIGATLSDNSPDIDNAELANKLGSYWDIDASASDWTWQIDIGGSEGVHWSNFRARGFRADNSVSAPDGGDHSLAPVFAAVSTPLNACGGLDNAAEIKDKVTIVRRESCLTLGDIQRLINVGAVGLITYLDDSLEEERFTVLISDSPTGWKIPIVTLPLREGELLRQIVKQRGAGVTLGVSGPILPPANKFDNMAAFSSLGPTYDGRIKPDLVSPGADIESADVLTDAEAANGTYCQKRSASGTSMATPIAAGAFTLLRQYFIDGFYPSGNRNAADSIVPSAALLKAVLINGAQALKGFESDGTPIDPPPSPKQGWGRINLATSVPIRSSSVEVEASAQQTPTNLIILDDVNDKLTGTDERGLCVDVAGSLEDLRATLAYTDHFGSLVSAGNLVNDLDLMLFYQDETASGKLLWPLEWNLGDATFHFNGDRHNNVERVIWSKPDVGRYWVSVSAHEVSVAQPFALAVTGEVTEIKDTFTKAACFYRPTLTQSPPPIPSPPPQPYPPPHATTTPTPEFSTSDARSINVMHPLAAVGIWLILAY